MKAILTSNLPIQIEGLSKAGIEKLSETIVLSVDDGNENAGELYLKLDFLKKSIEKSMKQIKDGAIEELNKYDKGQTLLGVEVGIMTKGKPSYSHNPVWTDKKKELTAIEDAMKLVSKTEEKIFDSEGVEIPPAIYSYSESITPRYPKS